MPTPWFPNATVQIPEHSFSIEAVCQRAAYEICGHLHIAVSQVVYDILTDNLACNYPSAGMFIAAVSGALFSRYVTVPPSCVTIIERCYDEFRSLPMELIRLVDIVRYRTVNAPSSFRFTTISSPAITGSSNTSEDEMDETIRDRTFGVEIEAHHQQFNRQEISAKLIAAGIEAEVEGYNHHVRPYWKLVTDASLSGLYGFEVVSPVLKGNEGLATLSKTLQTLSSIGCVVKKDCGLHVHVAGTENLDSLKRMIRVYNRYFPIISSFMAPSRRDNDYARQPGWNDDIAAANTMMGLRGTYGKTRGLNAEYWRYLAVNLEAMRCHGTVEFRQHQGSLNPVKVANWVRFCLRLAHRADQADAPAPNNNAVTGRTLLANELIAPAIRQNLGTVILAYVRDGNPRRLGTRGFDNYGYYRQGMTLRELVTQRGLGCLVHLRWDVDHRYVSVAENSGPVLVHSAPSIETAPLTLDGLMTLIGATPDEHAFFAGRTAALAVRQQRRRMAA